MKQKGCSEMKPNFLNDILTPNIINAVGNSRYEPLISGWLAHLSELLGTQVSFIFRISENDNMSMSNDNFIIIENPYIFSKKLNNIYELFNPTENKQCLIKEYLNFNEKSAAIIAYNFYENQKLWKEIPPDWSLHHAEKREFFKCHSEIIGLYKWILPIFIKNIIVGVFVISQVMENDFNDFDKIKKFFISIQKKFDLSFLPTEYEINDFIRSTVYESDYRSDKFYRFIESIDKIEYSLAVAHENAVMSHINDIHNKVLSIAWDKNNRYENTFNNNPIHYMASNLKLPTTALYDCILTLQDTLNINEVIVFKPRSEPNSIEIESTVVNKTIKTKLSKDNSYDLIFSHASFKFNIDSKSWKDVCKKNTGKFISHITTYDECKNFLIGEIPHDFSRSILFACAIKGYEDSPVAFLFEFDNKNKETSFVIETYLSWLKELLEQISIIYLVQWNMLIAEYYQKILHISNQYLTHEIGQIYAGLMAATESFQSQFNKFMDSRQKLNTMSFDEDALPNFLKKSIIYSKDVESMAAQINAIAKNAFVLTEKNDSNFVFFHPYKKIIYKLVKVYNQNAEVEDKQIIFPSITIDDPNRPMLYADPKMIEQIISNLLNNALKYSFSNSKIYLDAKITKNNQYVFTVTNYGLPIPIEEQEKIFDLGYRGQNALTVSHNGIGLGLYLAKKLALINNGYIDLKHCEIISPFCVPIMSEYLNLPDKYRDKIIENQCESELKRLKKIEKYDKIIKHESLIKKFSPIYFKRYIENPTAEIIFTLTIDQARWIK